MPGQRPFLLVLNKGMHKVGWWITVEKKRDFFLNFKTKRYRAQNLKTTFTPWYQSIILDCHLNFESTYTTQVWNCRNNDKK